MLDDNPLEHTQSEGGDVERAMFHVNGYAVSVRFIIELLVLVSTLAGSYALNTFKIQQAVEQSQRNEIVIEKQIEAIHALEVEQVRLETELRDFRNSFENTSDKYIRDYSDQRNARK